MDFLFPNYEYSLFEEEKIRKLYTVCSRYCALQKP